MAKPTRAPARKRAYQHAHLPVARRYSYTPALLAEARRRYEQTDERIVEIAADCGIHKTTFQRMANREGWVRFQPPPRDLSRAAKLAAQAEALAQAQAFDRHPEERAQRASKGDGPGLSSFEGGLWPPPQDDGKSLPPSPGTVARLRAAVENELATVERMRARMKDEPERPADAGITARTLARLTATLRDLQHMQRATPQPTGPDAYDDMPADLDEFRNELARRIRAFFAARRGGGDAGGDAAAPVAASGA